MKLFFRLSIVLLVIFSSACASKMTAIDKAAYDKQYASWSKFKAFNKLAPQEKSVLLTEYDVSYPLDDHGKKLLLNQYVHLLHRLRPTLEIWFKRAEKHLPYAKKVFVEKGLPEDLAYLAFIESGYNPYAFSSASASGCWQFMSFTGKRFGLRYESWIDERRDAKQAVHAAAEYLSILYDQFDDWSLAIASYNAGEGKIGRAVKLTRSKNFFELVKNNHKLRGRRRLAKETQHYVPRFMAMVKIARNHELLGFEPMDYSTAPKVAEIKAHGPVNLKSLTKATGMEWGEFKLLNPAFRRTSIPSKRAAHLYVPVEKTEIAMKHLTSKRYVNVASSGTYVVKKGDYLSRIARRHHTTVAKIKQANNLRSTVIRPKQKLRIPGTSSKKQMVAATKAEIISMPEPEIVTASAKAMPIIKAEKMDSSAFKATPEMVKQLKVVKAGTNKTVKQPEKKNITLAAYNQGQSTLPLRTQINLDKPHSIMGNVGPKQTASKQEAKVQTTAADAKKQTAKKIAKNAPAPTHKTTAKRTKLSKADINWGMNVGSIQKTQKAQNTTRIASNKPVKTRATMSKKNQNQVLEFIIGFGEHVKKQFNNVFVADNNEYRQPITKVTKSSKSKIVANL